MRAYLGIDVGAIGVKAAIVLRPARTSDNNGSRGANPLLGDLKPLATAGDGRPAIFIAGYRRTRGRPLAAVRELIEELLRDVPGQAIGGLTLTGSGASLVAEALGARRVNEFQAIAKAVGLLHPDVRTVVEMGGETSKYIRLEPDPSGSGLNILDYSTNGDCAAGTGAFLDQQAGRLLYAIEDIGRIVEDAQRAAQIAGRCSVFAKSDMIHAQQKGFTPPEVLRGLCKAVATNYKSAVVKGRTPHAPIALLGGVSANSAVVRELREAFDLQEDELFVPEAAESLAAVGAALIAAGESGASTGAGAGAGAQAVAQRLSLVDEPSMSCEGCTSCSHGAASFAASSHAFAAPSNNGKALDFAGQFARLSQAAGADGKNFPTSTPLDLSNVLLLRDQAQAYEFPSDGRVVDAYLGIDIGSVGTKLAVIDSHGAVIHSIFTRTEGRPIEVVSRCLTELSGLLTRPTAEGGGMRVRIRGVGTTGSGRELIGELVGADAITDEITCHKTGATFVGDHLLGKRPDTIFEIGGQDSKFISLASESLHVSEKGSVPISPCLSDSSDSREAQPLEAGRRNGDRPQETIVVDFTMNEACAAGTGSFLEERAAELGVSIKGEFSELALGSEAPIKLGERCTVFMERDVNTYMQRGAKREDVIAGLAYSVVYNYINRVVRGRPIGDCIFFQGGTAYNDAVAAAFSKVCGKQIIVPPHNAILGAIGAALVAHEKIAATGAHTRFRGFDMSEVDYTLREFTCKACGNTCSVQEFNVQGEKTYWGDKCSDRYRKRAKTTRQASIPDLVAMRHELLYREEDSAGERTGGTEGGQDARPPGRGGGTRGATRTIGIPLAMYTLDLLPLWRRFFRECGFKVVISDATDRRTARAGLDRVVAEPCYPIIVAHGHVADLVSKGVDYIWVPNILSAATKFMENESHVCPWGQTMPFVMRQAPAFQTWQNRILCPTLHFREGPDSVRKSLVEAVAPLGVPAKVARRAYDAAQAAQDAFKREYEKAGIEALETLARTGEPGMVLVGRPYNVHDAGVNLSVARKLRDYYGVNVIPIDALPLADIDVRDINDNMFWEYGRKILAAGKLVGRYPNLHIIYITNFKCGPDSFIKGFIRTASGKPFLTLQFDGHSNDAGMMTRCEAYLDSKGILRWWRQGKSKPATEVLRAGHSTSHKWPTPVRG